MNQIGMGSYSDRVYCDGLQVVVNLSNRELISAENSLLSEGLSFCPTPKDIVVKERRVRFCAMFAVKGVLY